MIFPSSALKRRPLSHNRLWGPSVARQSAQLSHPFRINLKPCSSDRFCKWRDGVHGCDCNLCIWHCHHPGQTFYWRQNQHLNSFYSENYSDYSAILCIHSPTPVKIPIADLYEIPVLCCSFRQLSDKFTYVLGRLPSPRFSACLRQRE